MSEQRRCVIIGAAPINNYEKIKTYLREDDFLICCDGGLAHLEALGKQPDLIVGDFDSAQNPGLPVETIVLPCEKDDTDTVFAAKEALRRGFREVLLIGAAGGRLDHTLGNVGILFLLEQSGGRGRIIDDFSEMELVGDTDVFVDERFSYFSLLNVSGTARGVTIDHAKYPLDGAEITCDYQYGISNEVLSGGPARVRVREGRLLLIKIF